VSLGDVKFALNTLFDPFIYITIRTESEVSNTRAYYTTALSLPE
jgi:hypothetical protein